MPRHLNVCKGIDAAWKSPKHIYELMCFGLIDRERISTYFCDL